VSPPRKWDDARAERIRALEAEVAALRRSESFRLGEAMVSLGRPGEMRGALRRLFRPRAEDSLPRAAGETGPPKAVERPGVLFVALGGGADAVEQVERAATMLVAAEPVLLTDSDDAAAAAPGFPVEHLIALDVWSRFRAPAEWCAYSAGRIAGIVEEYEIGTVVTLTPPPTGELSAILAPVVLRSMSRSETNLLA
jgi:hypothetical protein